MLGYNAEKDQAVQMAPCGQEVVAPGPDPAQGSRLIMATLESPGGGSGTVVKGRDGSTAYYRRTGVWTAPNAAWDILLVFGLTCMFGLPDLQHYFAMIS